MLKNSFEEHENVACSTECTGLMLTVPHTPAEDESMAELYSIHSAEGKDKKCRRKAKKRR